MATIDRDRPARRPDRGNRGPDHLGRLARPPRGPGALPPLQLQQRPAHLPARSGRHPGGRLRHLEEARSGGPQGRAGHLDPGSDDRPPHPERRGRGAPPHRADSDRWPYSTSPRPTGIRYPRSVATSRGTTRRPVRCSSPNGRAGSGYSVDITELPGSTNGDCSFARRRIRVEGRNDPAQQVKTLAHELAHALLHEGTDDRALAELEAESTAFVVCRTPGHRLRRLLLRLRRLLGRRRTRGRGPHQVVGGRIQRAASSILETESTATTWPADRRTAA